MKMHRLIVCGIYFFFFLIITKAVLAENNGFSLSLYGQAKYPVSMSHFAYANPNAPKSGTINLAAYGTFDSFNPFLFIGTAPRSISNLIYTSLMIPSQDEIETLYPAIAESYELASDNSHITFNIHPQAVFSDGKPISCEDAQFSFQAIQMNPNYKRFLQEIDHVSCLSKLRPRYHFKNKTNRELPLIAASLNILPKHFWEGRSFDSDLLRVPISSGPYVIEKFKTGNDIVYRRIKNWWAKDIPSFKGRYNFDRIKYVYYRNIDALFESFKSGDLDFHEENTAQKWAEGYNFQAILKKQVIRKIIKNNNPQSMQSIVFNMRHPYFKNINIRKAFNYCYNFEWLNHTFFYNSYTRTTSFFQNTALAAKELPNPKQIEILKSYHTYLPEGVMDQVFSPPNGTQNGIIRDQLIEALTLFEKGGWRLKDGRMLDENDQPVTIEYLYYDKSYDRIILPFANKLKLLGIELKLRLVDTNQFLNRMENQDFQMMPFTFPSTHTPGFEQYTYWGSQSADAQGTMNISGLKNPAVDDLIRRMLIAETYDELQNLTQCLDRILQFSWLCIPQWHLGQFRIAYWDRFGIPKNQAKYSIGFIDTWWIDSQKNQKLNKIINRPAI